MRTCERFENQLSAASSMLDWAKNAEHDIVEKGFSGTRMLTLEKERKRKRNTSEACASSLLAIKMGSVMVQRVASSGGTEVLSANGMDSCGKMSRTRI